MIVENVESVPGLEGVPAGDVSAETPPDFGGGPADVAPEAGGEPEAATPEAVPEV